MVDRDVSLLSDMSIDGSACGDEKRFVFVL